MIWIFTDRPTEGGVLLREHIRALGAAARRLRGTPRRFREGDTIICWGRRYEGKVPPQVEVFNSEVGRFAKFNELKEIGEKGVVVPEVSASPREGFLGRSLHHQGGMDLLSPPANPAYWTRKLPFKREFRIHIFRGLTLRVGMKVPNTEGEEVHPWIRSREAGWRISYGEEAQKMIRQVARDAARNAVEALGLDFGAVDVGVLGSPVGALPKGTPVVLEVNSAPGLDNATAHRYAEKFCGKEHVPLAA